MEMYDRILAQNTDATSDVTAGIAAVNITGESEVTRLQARQRAAVEREVTQGKERYREHDANVHPDLQDLNFGPLGASSNNLPPPLRPSTLSDDGQDEATYGQRGSLSDFSDFDSSDEDRPGASASPRKRGGRDYVNVSDDPDDDNITRSAKVPLVQAEDNDPFADPFADEIAVGPSRKW